MSAWGPDALRQTRHGIRLKRIGYHLRLNVVALGTFEHALFETVLLRVGSLQRHPRTASGAARMLN